MYLKDLLMHMQKALAKICFCLSIAKEKQTLAAVQKHKSTLYSQPLWVTTVFMYESCFFRLSKQHKLNDTRVVIASRIHCRKKKLPFPLWCIKKK